MRARLAGLAFLVGVLNTGVAWLTVQPLLARLVEVGMRLAAPGSPEVHVLARVRAALPLLLGLDFVVASLLTYAALGLTVGGPLQRLQGAVEALGRLDLKAPLAHGGLLLSRVHRALERMAEALRSEQALTQSQLAELRRSNERLARAQTELAASERLATVGRLAAGVAHEVGNPLAGILGYLSLARAKSPDPEVRDFLERIDGEVQRIDGIVRGLLDLGRPPSAQSVLLDVGRVAQACVQLVRAAPELAGVDVVLDVAPDALARGDAGALSQVLINLLLNAAQAGAPRVWVRAAREGDAVRVDVEDAGPGIPEAALGHLFEPFFTTRAPGKGTGLGLAISRHLVEIQGGRLTAANREGGGARFSLSLPAA